MRVKAAFPKYKYVSYVDGFHRPQVTSLGCPNKIAYTSNSEILRSEKGNYSTFIRRLVFEIQREIFQSLMSFSKSLHLIELSVHP